MWHVLETEQVHAGFWWRDPMEREHLEDLGADTWITLKCIVKKWDWGTWTGSSWLRIGTGGGHLWIR